MGIGYVPVNNAHIKQFTEKKTDSPAYSKCSAEIQSAPGALFKGSFWRSDVSETTEHMGISCPIQFSLQSMLCSKDSADSLAEFSEFNTPLK